MTPLYSCTHETSRSYYLKHFTDSYSLYAGCERGRACDGKSCVAENKCPQGCAFSECLQHARAGNADGFSFRGMGFAEHEPFCKICTRKQLDALETLRYSGVYIKKGKHYLYVNRTKLIIIGVYYS